MALPTVNSTLDPVLGIVTPNNTGTWADLAGTTWANWHNWNNQPADPMIWLTETITVPFDGVYTLRILTEAEGQVAYTVYTSTTGAFAGEETTTTIASGATTVSSFTGSYVKVAIEVTNTGLPTVLKDVRVTASDFTVDINIRVNTATLSGSAGSRTLVLPRTISGIANMTVTAESVTAYTPDVYVTDISTSTQAIAQVVDIDYTAPKVGVYKMDGYPTDGVVNVKIRALPQQKMDGNNLISV